MTRNSSMMRKLMVLMMAFAIMLTYSVVPMNQSFAASGKKPTKITLNAKSKTLRVGKTFKAKVKAVKPKKASKAVTWKSSNKKVATVNSKGVIKAKKTGKATITAVSKKNKKVKAKIKVTVKGPVKETDANIGAAKSRVMNVYVDMSKYPKGKTIKVWLPIPQNDEHLYQRITDVEYEVSGTRTAKETVEKENNNRMLYIEWDKNAEPEDRLAKLSFAVTRFAVSRENLADDPAYTNSDEAEKYINKESVYVKVKAPIVQETAAAIVEGKEGTVAKARAIYDWVIDNLERIDDGEELTLANGSTHTYAVEGCGYGDTVKILTDLKDFGRAGGHCTDLNSTFVALCRAAGIPAREMFGIRLGNGDVDNATGYQHCWAEFYLPGTGWVYADPGDVLKAVKGKNKSMTIAEVKEAKAKADKEKFWAKVDNNRVVLSRGRDIIFNPAQAWGECNTFGYPAAEIDGRRLETSFTNGPEFKYTITGVEPGKLDYEYMWDPGWKDCGIDLDSVKSEDFVVDVRKASLFDASHYPGSVSAPVVNEDNSTPDADTLKANLEAAYSAAAGKRIVIVCNSGNTLARRAMAYYQSAGKDMKNITYLIGGAKALKDAGLLSVKDFPNMDTETWKSYGVAAIGTTDSVVDVRAAEHFAQGHIEGAVSVPGPANGAFIEPGSEAAKGLDAAYEAAKTANKKIVLICYSGNRYAKAAMEYLYNSKEGVDKSQVTYLIGGFNGYKVNNPYVVGAVKVDPAAKSVAIKAKVNSAYTTEAKDIYHLIRTESYNADAAFLSDADVFDFHQAIAGLDARPWSDKPLILESGQKLSDVPGENADFTHMDVLIDGKPLAGYLKFKEKGVEKSASSVLDMAYSGNLENQKQYKTGCIACLQSCFAGVVTNNALGFGTTSKEGNYFWLDTGKLSAGQEVTFTFRLK